MQNILGYITWDVSPFIYDGEHFAISWYGTLWVFGLMGLLITLLLTFRYDGVPQQYALITFIVTLVFVIFFGHLFQGLFYEWEYVSDNPAYAFGTEWHYRNWYFEHPWKFLDITHGGFSSHGTVLGVILAGCTLGKWLKTDKWFFIDRGMMGLFWVGIAVRVGNLINNEIYGIETTLPWGFVFGEDTLPSHPTQIYEILSYILVIGIAWWMFLKKDGGVFKGLISATMMIIVMLLRIIIEAYKNPQMDIENNWSINMGQILSIPFAIWAVWLIFHSFGEGKQNNLIHVVTESRAERRRKRK